MRKITILAALDLPAVFLDECIVAGTIHVIERTIAEQAVDILSACVAGIVLAVFICEECR